MKKIILLLSITLALSMSIVADVGTGTRSSQSPPSPCLLNTQVMPVNFIAVEFQSTQVVINSASVITPVRVSLSPVSPPFTANLFIDPGRYMINKALLSNIYNPITLNDQTLIQLSYRPNSTKFNNIQSWKYRSSTSPPSPNFKLQTPNFKLSSTTRHVFS